jgi:hypothetical protein
LQSIRSKVTIKQVKKESRVAGVEMHRMTLEEGQLCSKVWTAFLSQASVPTPQFPQESFFLKSTKPGLEDK